MNDLTDLYADLILDHSRSPRGEGELKQATASAEGFNPLCGDKLQVQIQLTGNKLTAVKFTGEGCAISRASASLMTEAVVGKSTSEIRQLTEQFQKLVTGKATPDLGKLLAFAGVRQFPLRVKCATLAWHALAAALAGKSTITTE